MSASLVLFLILVVGVVALLCGPAIVVAAVQWEAWAIAAVVTLAVTLATLGVVV
jgi:hypothetical protein